MTLEFEESYFWSRDGLRLHYRHLDGPRDRPTLLCLPGLTRNCRDFEVLAGRLAGGWRMLMPSLRGRGESAYAKDPLSYVPLTYLQDLEVCLRSADVDRFAVIGTSLGGLLALVMAPTHREAMAGALLNDVGPVLEEEGLARIRGYVGKSGSWPTWLHAARDLAQLQRTQFPDYAMSEWLAMAKRLCRVSPAGRIGWDYDPRIAEPFRLPHGDTGIDLWAGLAALAGKPVLSVRGALSDLFTAQNQQAMRERLPDLVEVVVPRVGHAPTLLEPEVQPALDRWLAAL